MKNTFSIKTAALVPALFLTLTQLCFAGIGNEGSGGTDLIYIRYFSGKARLEKALSTIPTLTEKEQNNIYQTIRPNLMATLQTSSIHVVNCTDRVCPEIRYDSPSNQIEVDLAQFAKSPVSDDEAAIRIGQAIAQGSGAESENIADSLTSALLDAVAKRSLKGTEPWTLLEQMKNKIAVGNKVILDRGYLRLPPLLLNTRFDPTIDGDHQTLRDLDTPLEVLVWLELRQLIFDSLKAAQAMEAYTSESIVKPAVMGKTQILVNSADQIGFNSRILSWFSTPKRNLVKFGDAFGITLTDKVNENFSGRLENPFIGGGVVTIGAEIADSVYSEHHGVICHGSSYYLKITSSIRWDSSPTRHQIFSFAKGSVLKALEEKALKVNSPEDQELSTLFQNLKKRGIAKKVQDAEVSDVDSPIVIDGEFQAARALGKNQIEVSNYYLEKNPSKAQNGSFSFEDAFSILLHESAHLAGYDGKETHRKLDRLSTLLLQTINTQN
jgi:hypothetical protein